MQKKLTFFILLYFGIFSCFSQEDKPIELSYKSTVFGLGKANVYDTYLSPLNYSGDSYSLMEEYMKMTKLLGGNIAEQQLFHIDFSSTQNKAGNSINYTGLMEYNYGLFYRFTPISNLNIFAGSQANGLAGFVYNVRNSNNPVTAKAHLSLTLSGAASYNFKIKSQPVRLRYQISSPFAGLMFSPQYGQSYYEISLGDEGQLIYFSSYHNHLSLRNSFSIEIPLRFMTLRAMYVHSIYETFINNIDTRIHNNSLMIGFSEELFTVSGKKPVKGNYKRIFE